MAKTKKIPKSVKKLFDEEVAQFPHATLKLLDYWASKKSDTTVVVYGYDAPLPSIPGDKVVQTRAAIVCGKTKAGLIARDDEENGKVNGEADS